MKILVINGPNLNMLGIREPEIYGNESLADLEAYLRNYCENPASDSGSAGKPQVEISFFQSNWEGAIIDTIQEAYGKIDGIIINPAAYTHTSLAIADAIKAVNIPTVEVHLSDLKDREDFRQNSYISPVCLATITGKHFEGYAEAVDLLVMQFEKVYN